MPYFTHRGYRFHYRAQGDGPLLLILPGNTASSALHAGELAHFGQRYQAVSLDFLGTGQSDRVGQWPLNWWEDGAGDALALIEHLGCDRAFVMGTSGGGVIALMMGLRAPGRVAAIVADSCVAGLDAAALRASVAGRQPEMADGGAFWRAAHGDDWREVVSADSDLLLRWAERGGVDWFADGLSAIRCPVLLTASLRDSLLPQVAEGVERMARQIEQSYVFLASQGDHPLMWSQPDEFRAISGWFLNGIATTQVADIS
ncbi:MAG: alpha/beta hydrolase [Anaerolineae bacterium]